jgi:hypothetical protein
VVGLETEVAREKWAWRAVRRPDRAGRRRRGVEKPYLDVRAPEAAENAGGGGGEVGEGFGSRKWRLAGVRSPDWAGRRRGG